MTMTNQVMSWPQFAHLWCHSAMVSKGIYGCHILFCKVSAGSSFSSRSKCRQLRKPRCSSSEGMKWLCFHRISHRQWYHHFSHQHWSDALTVPVHRPVWEPWRSCFPEWSIANHNGLPGKLSKTLQPYSPIPFPELLKLNCKLTRLWWSNTQ